MSIQITLTKDQELDIVKKYNKNQEKEPLTYSIIDASKALGISKSTINRLINDGEITKIKIGKSPRIEKTEIEKFLTK